MTRHLNHLLAWAAAVLLTAVAARGAVAINDLEVTNIGTTRFTVVWTTSEVSTPGLEVYSDSGGTNAVGGTLGLEYYPIAEADPAVDNNSGARASRRALELLAINRRVVSVRVTGLSPGTTYYVRPRTFGLNGADNGASIVPLRQAATAQFTSLVVDARLLRVRFLAFAGEGMIALVNGPAGTAPLSAIVGDSTAPDSVVLPLANLLDITGGTNALFDTPQQLVIRVIGVGAPADTYTPTIDFASAFKTAKLELIDAGTAPATHHSADTNHDFKLGLTELLRVIELFNTRNGTVRTGAYVVDANNTEDGFGVDPDRNNTAVVTLAKYHSADINHDAKLGLTELLRVIELYNYRSGTVRTGDYHIQAGTEDGFGTGP